MSKKWIVLIISLALCLIMGGAIGIAAYTKQKEPLVHHKRSDLSMHIYNQKDWKVGTLAEILRQEENVPIEQLTLQSTISPNLISGRNIRLYLSSVSYLLTWYNNGAYQTDYIKMLNDDLIAVVFHVEMEKTALIPRKPVYQVLLFERQIRTVDNNEEWEQWVSNGENYYINQTFSFADFAGIREGDSVERFCEIDDSVWYDLRHGEQFGAEVLSVKEGMENEEIIQYKRFFKLLEDGIMEVRYDNKDHTITSILFYNYGSALPETISSLKDPILVSIFQNEKKE